MRKNKKAFTLIELLIVISLMMVVLSFVFLPYAHYQEKIKVKQVIREASQAILESRNLAINGYDEEIATNIFENKSIGVYFSNLTDEKADIHIYSYPYDVSDDEILPGVKNDVKEFRSGGRQLPTGTEFMGAFKPNGDSIDNIFFFFNAISGDTQYYTFNSSSILNSLALGDRQDITGDTLKLQFSYKGSDSSVLNAKIQYNTRVHTIDYGLGID